MKTIVIAICLCLVLSSSTCEKESNDCHYDIAVVNGSSESIIVAIPILNSNGECRLDGSLIEARQTYYYRPFHHCIENSIGNNLISIYLVDSVQFNDPNIYYDCDSINYFNTILATWDFTLEDLNQIDFIITYP